MNARDKGHGFERWVVQAFRRFWPGCVTSRAGAPRADAGGVDLVGTGCFNFQCKAVERGLSYHEVLRGMPEDGKFNIVLHKKNRAGVVVVLPWEDFVELLELMRTEGMI